MDCTPLLFSSQAGLTTDYRTVVMIRSVQEDMARNSGFIVPVLVKISKTHTIDDTHTKSQSKIPESSYFGGVNRWRGARWRLPRLATASSRASAASALAARPSRIVLVSSEPRSLATGRSGRLLSRGTYPRTNK